jgi:hypothetical protein
VRFDRFADIAVRDTGQTGSSCLHPEQTMLEDVPTREHGPEASEFSDGESLGHVLYERFLVERDLTDASLGGGFRVFLVKDLKNYCSETILKLSRLVRDDAGPGGPSLKEVGEALAQVAHPNIEEFLETGRFGDGRPFALTRPYPAASLDRSIEQGRRLELEGIAELVDQITDGLSAAHARGILHCDLRPANILVPAGDIGANGLKIINFGSAWPIDVRGESLANVRPGSESLHYAAPELLVALGHRSPACDIYSLSVLVYRLLAGSLPFEAPDRAGQLESIAAGHPSRSMESRTDLSVEAEELIFTGLDFEPVRRPQNIEEFGLRLVRLLRPPRGFPGIEIPAERDADIEPVIWKAAEATVEPPRAERPLLKKPARRISSEPVAQRAPVSDRAVAWALIVLLMGGALSIPIGQTLLKKQREAAAIDTIADRPTETAARKELRYWFEPHGSKSGSPLSAYRSNFIGDGAQLAFAIDSPGHAYVFYEFVGGDDRPGYELRFPAADSTEAVKGVEADKQFKPAPPDVRSPRAVWIVWTAVKNGELESIRGSAPDGSISNEDDRRRLRHFLERNRNLRVAATTDETTGQTVLDGSGDKIVHRIDLSDGQ